jgi:hypothetical protein
LIPFHVYDGDALVIHGHAHNYARLCELTRGTGHVPVHWRDGQRQVGFAELWVVQYHDTVVGPYDEVVLNFVVRGQPRAYRWNSRYSSVVPMMDARNRLFTPSLILNRDAPIQYGNRLLATHKFPGKIRIWRDRGRQHFECFNEHQGRLKGSVPEGESFFGGVADAAELSREIGAVEMARNVRQAVGGEEIAGGLLSIDGRDGSSDGKRKVLDVRAVYKFFPRFVPVNESDVDYQGGGPLIAELAKIGFEPTIAAREPHIKSILYLDGWPTPGGESREDRIPGRAWAGPQPPP